MFLQGLDKSEKAQEIMGKEYDMVGGATTREMGNQEGRQSERTLIVGWKAA